MKKEQKAQKEFFLLRAFTSLAFMLTDPLIKKPAVGAKATEATEGTEVTEEPEERSSLLRSGETIVTITVSPAISRSGSETDVNISGSSSKEETESVVSSEASGSVRQYSYGTFNSKSSDAIPTEKEEQKMKAQAALQDKVVEANAFARMGDKIEVAPVVGNKPEEIQENAQIAQAIFKPRSHKRSALPKEWVEQLKSQGDTLNSNNSPKPNTPSVNSEKKKFAEKEQDKTLEKTEHKANMGRRAEMRGGLARLNKEGFLGKKEKQSEATGNPPPPRL